MNRATRFGLASIVVAAIVGTGAAPTFAEAADGRHAELISSDLGPGGDAASMYADVSRDGNSVIFTAGLPEPSSVQGGVFASFVARRGASGWHSLDTSLPGSNGPATGPQANEVVLRPPDAERLIVATFGQQDPTAPVSDPTQRRFFETVPGASTGRSLLRPPLQNTVGLSVLDAQQTTSSVFFEVGLGPNPSELADSAGTPIAPRVDIARLDQNGISIATRLPDGALPTAENVVQRASQPNLYGLFNLDGFFPTSPRAGTGRSDISVDGRRLFFNAYDTAGKAEQAQDNVASPLQPLFLSDAGSPRAIAVSKSDVDGGAKPARFLGASADGDLSYFVTNESLDAAHDGGGVYRYQLSNRTLQRLTPSLQGASIDTLQIATAFVSRDASTVYFVTAAGLGGGAQDGGRNLYVWRDGDYRFIGDLGPDGELTAVSRNGAFAVARSSAPLAGASTGGYSQFFRYSYPGDDLRCASCRADGSANAGPSLLEERFFTGTARFSAPRVVSDDGHVFFTAKDRLVSTDQTMADDVYEFTGRELLMLSDGRGSSSLTDNSDDGRSVYFISSAALVPEDTDGSNADLYVRRTGPDISRPATASPCVGDACQGVQQSPPLGRDAGSIRNGTVDNVARRRKVSPTLLGRPSLSRGALKELARGEATRARVRVRGSGRIIVRGTSKLNSRSKPREVARGAARGRASASRTIEVAVRLNTLGSSQLRRNGSLKILLEAQFGGTSTKTAFSVRKDKR